jgi:hypothetical protein
LIEKIRRNEKGHSSGLKGGHAGNGVVASSALMAPLSTCFRSLGGMGKGFSTKIPTTLLPLRYVNFFCFIRQAYMFSRLLSSHTIFVLLTM